MKVAFVLDDAIRHFFSQLKCRRRQSHRLIFDASRLCSLVGFESIDRPDKPVYFLVSIVPQQLDVAVTEANVRRAIGVPKIRPLTLPGLRERLTRREHPPYWCPGAVFDRGRWPGTGHIFAGRMFGYGQFEIRFEEQVRPCLEEPSS